MEVRVEAVTCALSNNSGKTGSKNISQSVCNGNKASFQRTPSYRSVPLGANSLLDGEICIFCLQHSLAKIFAENPARFIHCHDTCNSWATYQAFDGLTASGKHFRTTFLMLFRVV
ncbi:hypothetical protein TNCV_1866521 [Trichonephila clavipes]|nr:hypothetical protein TNCV_1866521 [Trichonephila clavipes]